MVLGVPFTVTVIDCTPVLSVASTVMSSPDALHEQLRIVTTGGGFVTVVVVVVDVVVVVVDDELGGVTWGCEIGGACVDEGACVVLGALVVEGGTVVVVDSTNDWR